MNQVRDFSDKRISSRCCFCGDDGSTGDHVPSKAFLDEPFPENLMIVRCCKECNHSFSADEEYAACVIEVARCGSLDVEREKVKRMLAHNPSGRGEIWAAADAIRTNVSPVVRNGRIENVVNKVAKGLATFMAGMWVSNIESRVFVLSKLSSSDKDAFEALQPYELWPEAGSRLLQQVVVLNNSEILPLWDVCQEGRFRYLIVQKYDWCEVRMVFSEYLAVIARCA